MAFYSFKDIKQLRNVRSGNVYRAAAEEFDFVPQDGERTAVGFRGLRDVLIDGNNAVLRLKGRGYYFVLEACERVTLRGFTLETVDPEYLEFTVLSSGLTGAEIRLSGEYSPAIIDSVPQAVCGGTDLFSPDVKRSVYCRGSDSDAVVRVNGDPLSKIKGASKLVRGDTYSTLKLSFSGLSSLKKDCVYAAFPENGMCPAILLVNCKDVIVRDMTVRYAHGSAVKADMCENVKLKNVALRAQTRRSAAALGSAVEAIECIGRIDMENCRLAACLGNTVSVKGLLHTPQSVNADGTVTLADSATALAPFEKGDLAAFTEADTFARKCELTVASYDKSSRVLRFDSPVPADCAGCMLENASLHTADVTCRDTVLYGSAADGLAFATSGGVKIEKCSFKTINGSAIVCTSGKGTTVGLPSSVEISDNTFSQCFGTSIDISPVSRGNEAVGEVRIENNGFGECGKVAIAASHCRSLTAKRNLGDTDKYACKISQCRVTDADRIEYKY